MTEHRKVTPQHEGGISPALIFVGAGLGALLIALAIVIGSSDADDIEPDPTPTTVPAPVFEDGTTLADEMTLYVTENTSFSVIAAEDNLNEDLPLTRCDSLSVSRSDESQNYYFYLDTTGESDRYWVYGTAADLSNGWVPVDLLAPTPPDDCPAQEE